MIRPYLSEPKQPSSKIWRRICFLCLLADVRYISWFDKFQFRKLVSHAFCGNRRVLFDVEIECLVPTFLLLVHEHTRGRGIAFLPLSNLGGRCQLDHERQIVNHVCCSFLSLSVIFSDQIFVWLFCGTFLYCI